jgi:hypothetical protein
MFVPATWHAAGGVPAVTGGFTPAISAVGGEDAARFGALLFLNARFGLGQNPGCLCRGAMLLPIRSLLQQPRLHGLLTLVGAILRRFHTARDF